ncbi:hypothetical protein K8O68_17625 [Salipaludibacillus sp. CUR1]|uniref:hypothetical protein n=1 Tax=Salipaludibacillus sp. CUR1 TaxID=2820003 RepID=UPI001E3DFEF8|nr:hypothetical protein [Salipaludibacillus sp. CUR1]MCE7794204.1 hypothetical protein [Salipaludibacillus sp. CUR1]
MAKKLFYVAWHGGSYIRLQPVKTDTRTVQYEVEADEQEKQQLEQLIAQVNKNDVIQEHIFVRPFDEYQDDMDKNEFQDEVRELFQLIYELGTEKTRDYLKNLDDAN